MTKKELYQSVCNGTIYGYKASYGYHCSLYSGEGHDGKGGYKDFIFFEHFGRWASRVSYKEFAKGFSVAWESVKDFLKENEDITEFV